jgi:hypothetical protein
MELAITIIIVSVVSIAVGILWVNGINYMDKNYIQIIKVKIYLTKIKKMKKRLNRDEKLKQATVDIINKMFEIAGHPVTYEDIKGQKRCLVPRVDNDH